jgi:hypothetical protein
METKRPENTYPNTNKECYSFGGKGGDVNDLTTLEAEKI